VRDPLVVHWPAGVVDGGGLRRQFCHAVDVAATVLDVAGASLPEQFGGYPQIPLHGRSLVPTFRDAAAPAPRSVQYFEQMGHRGIWVDGWKATTYHEPGHPYDLDEWELFHLDSDFSECHDLSREQPDRLRDLVDVWWSEAGAMGVLPLDDRTIELFGSEVRPGTPHAATTYTYLPPVSHVPADASPLVGGRAWTVSAYVVVDGTPVSGVLYARGGHNVGHSFFVADGNLHFDYNALGTHHRASAPLDLRPGTHVLSARFDRAGPGGVLTIGTDGMDLASVEIPWVVRMLGSTGMDIGCDRLSEVVDDYRGPNPFTGRIERLTVEIRGRMAAEDVAATARVEMARE